MPQQECNRDANICYSELPAILDSCSIVTRSRFYCEDTDICTHSRYQPKSILNHWHQFLNSVVSGRGQCTFELSLEFVSEAPSAAASVRETCVIVEESSPSKGLVSYPELWDVSLKRTVEYCIGNVLDWELLLPFEELTYV